MEVAAGGAVDGAGDVAHDVFLVAPDCGVGDGDGGHQCLRVGVQGLGEDRCFVGVLDDAA